MRVVDHQSVLQVDEKLKAKGHKPTLTEIFGGTFAQQVSMDFDIAGLFLYLAIGLVKAGRVPRIPLRRPV